MKRYDQRALGRLENERYQAGDKLTPLRAIFAKCYECCNGVRPEIENCNIKNCPLWPHNPYIRTPNKHFKGNAEALAKARANKLKGI